jgi:hypothetical protein
MRHESNKKTGQRVVARLKSSGFRKSSDYDYVRFHRNRPAYYGDGWTEVERNGGDPIAYMHAIDYILAVL